MPRVFGFKNLATQRQNGIVKRHKYLPKFVGAEYIPPTHHRRSTTLEKEVMKVLHTLNTHIVDRDIAEITRDETTGEVTCRFHQEEFAHGILRNRLVGNGRFYGNKSRLFIEPSLIDEYAMLREIIRRAFEEGKVHSFRLRGGVNQVKVNKDDEFVDITHRTDLVNLGIN